MCGQRSPRPTQPRRRLLIVDDHPLVRHGLGTLFASESDLAACGKPVTWQAVLE
jgi:DNA-binding NarL/FixJ family response regulator